MRRIAFHVVLLALVCLLPSRVVFADAATETKAKALQKKAMDDDYLVNVNAAAAETKLKSAIAMCANSKCGNALASKTTEFGKLFMGGIGQRSAVVAGNTGYFMTLLVGEIRQSGLFDEAEGVFMMAAALDHHAGVVQEGGALQQAQSMVIQFVQGLGCMKKLGGEALYLASMRPVFYEQSAA